jgi:hypothetical protein
MYLCQKCKQLILQFQCYNPTKCIMLLRALCAICHEMEARTPVADRVCPSACPFVSNRELLDGLW